MNLFSACTMFQFKPRLLARMASCGRDDFAKDLASS